MEDIKTLSAKNFDLNTVTTLTLYENIDVIYQKKGTKRQT